MRNHPCEKFPQENYNKEDTLYSNHRRSETSIELEEEESTTNNNAFNNWSILKVKKYPQYSVRISFSRLILASSGDYDWKSNRDGIIYYTSLHNNFQENNV